MEEIHRFILYAVYLFDQIPYDLIFKKDEERNVNLNL